MEILKDIRVPGACWTFGTTGVDGRFGAALPAELHVFPGYEIRKPPKAHLSYWEDKGEDGQALCTRTIKCRSYREAVRVLRRHLKGYDHATTKTTSTTCWIGSRSGRVRSGHGAGVQPK